MQALRQFSIPYKGLKDGIHEFEFEIQNDFFSAFEDSPVSTGQLISALLLEKKSDHLILNFKTSGTVDTECDRCTSEIQLPINFANDYIVKFGEDEEEEDVVYIHPDSHEINVARLLYEQIVLALPLIKIYDCGSAEPRPCNDKVLEILNAGKVKSETQNPFGDLLKDFKK